MFEKLDVVDKRYVELEAVMSREGLDGREIARLSKERAAIEDIVLAYREHKGLLKAQVEAKELLKTESDPELKALAKEELDHLEKSLQASSDKLIRLTLPRDPNDDKNVILEIRAGTGGEEAALFAADLLRMYIRLANRSGWKTEVLNSTSTEKGGFKEVVLSIEGQKVYSRLKFESGAHRVQRVPETEAQGRVHTSAVTVAILPEADEVEVSVNPADLEITLCRSSGAGGQHVNTTDSAVRMVHKPTGIVVECQDERSQHKNRDRALKIMKAKLYEKARSEQDAAISAERRSQVGSGDRSEKIRTYNFPQSRVTDHRINMTLYRLDNIMDGDFGEILDGLAAYFQAELLKKELAKK